MAYREEVSIQKTSIVVGLVLALGQVPTAIASPAVNAELDLFQPIFGGYGASVGVELDHWGLGIMGFATDVNEDGRRLILDGAEDLGVYNWAAEMWGD